MKRIAKFTMFKVLEIAGAALIWWGLSWYGYWLVMLVGGQADLSIWWCRWLLLPVFCGGLCGIVIPVAVVCVSYTVIFDWIQWNWEKAGK